MKGKTKMKRLNITTEQFNRSTYFQKKYGKLKYVSESGKLFKTSKGKVLKFNEAGPHRVADDEDLDVPVTEQEELLCKYIPDEIEEFCRKNGLEVTCGCNPHNTGEEQHIEIYVGIPEGDDPTDPKYDNIEVNLEMLVNGIGDAENEGEKWGDASFQWISDEEIFGELWPLEQSQINEVNGWKLEDEDLTLVNSESDGDKLYIVKLWWGSGYQLDCYNAYAFSDEEALNYVVAYIEKTDPKSLETIDENANDYLQELVDEGEAASIEEAYEHPYFQETYLWVDATREGAEQGHYIYNENLQIAEYPEEHDYPMSKGIKRESRRKRKFGRKFVKESSNGDKAKIERLCTNLEKQYDTLTYDEIEGKLKKAGFVLDEYGGKTNAYAVFVHDCGIVVNMEYQFVKDYGTRDSWHAANVTYFGWYDDPKYQRWSNESTKRIFEKKFVKESSVRKCTNELLDYAEAYPNFWETIAKACLSYMSEDEVEDMARMNDLLPDDDEYTDY